MYSPAAAGLGWEARAFAHRTWRLPDGVVRRERGGLAAAPLCFRCLARGLLLLAVLHQVVNH